MTYVRRRTVNRQTSTTIEVLDLKHPDSVITPDPNRWATFCVDHGEFVTHATIADAEGWAAQPATWCERCQYLLVALTKDHVLTMGSAHGGHAPIAGWGGRSSSTTDPCSCGEWDARINEAPSGTGRSSMVAWHRYDHVDKVVRAHFDDPEPTRNI